ncbi:MAG: hypothetical protein KJ922_01545, partial [Nanoarchaeota archaeon]|nr:hypothetical protein [Nanoarchaeota archaeon]
MKNKFLWLSLLVTSVVSTTAYAQQGPMQNVFKFLYDFFGWIPTKLSTLLGGNADLETVFYAKFLLWALMFAILYWGGLKVFKDAPKGVQITVPLVLSIMSVVLIPNAILRDIFGTYTLVATIVIWVIPLAAIMFINHSITHKFGGSRAGYIIKFFIFTVGAVILSRMAIIIPATFIETRQYSVYFGLMTGLMVFAAIWSAIRFAKPDGGAPAYAGGGVGGWLKGSFDSWGKGNSWSGANRSGWGGLGYGEAKKLDRAEEPLIQREEQETREEEKEEHKEQVDTSKSIRLDKYSMKDNKKTIADLKQILEVFRAQGLAGLHNDKIRKKLAEAYKFDQKEVEALQKMQWLTAQMDQMLQKDFRYLQDTQKTRQEAVARARTMGIKDFNERSFGGQLTAAMTQLQKEFTELRNQIEPIEVELRKSEMGFRQEMQQAQSNATTIDQNLSRAIQFKERQEQLLEELKKLEQKLRGFEKHEKHALMKMAQDEKELKKYLRD